MNSESSLIQNAQEPASEAPLSPFEQFISQIGDEMISDTSLLTLLEQHPSFGREVHRNGFNALMHCILSRRIDLAQKLIPLSDVNHQTPAPAGWTSLILSAPYPSLFSSLLEAGADPLTTTPTGLSPLVALCTYGDFPLVSRLLSDDRFHQIFEKELQGWPPIFAAIQSGNLSLVKLLVDHGADVKQVLTPKNQWSCMHQAIRSSFEIAQFLYHQGAPIHTQDYEGNTVLHVAAQFKRTEAAQWLVSLGLLNVAQENRYGDLPVDYLDSSCTELRQLLSLPPHASRIPHPDKYKHVSRLQHASHHHEASMDEALLTPSSKTPKKSSKFLNTSTESSIDEDHSMEMEPQDQNAEAQVKAQVKSKKTLIAKDSTSPKSPASSKPKKDGKKKIKP